MGEGGKVRRRRGGRGRASICFVFWEAKRERERSERRFFFLFSSFIGEKGIYIIYIYISSHILSHLVVGDERVISKPTGSFVLPRYSLMSLGDVQNNGFSFFCATLSPLFIRSTRARARVRRLCSHRVGYRQSS